MTSSRAFCKAMAALGALALTLTACTSTTGGEDTAGGGDTADDAGEALVVGTTDKVTTIDPAGAYDNGSFLVMLQAYPFLMGYEPGTPDVRPEIAESAEFTEPTTYEVTLQEGLTFANGNELTSSDVKFSFDRQLGIQHPSGPSSLLGGLESVETPDETTVIFNLSRPNDQTFPLVLAGPAGPIVDEEVFSADELTPDDEIVEADAFGGPYQIDSFQFNELIAYTANPEYAGELDPRTQNVQMSYYTDSNNMKLDVQEGAIDVAWRSLSATDIEDLESQDGVNVHQGPGGEIRYIVFNFATMPFGTQSEAPDEAKAQAVRQAMAHSLDREAIAQQVYKGTFAPLYSHVPAGLPGATESLEETYGDGQGGPDVDAARQALEDAGVETPIDLKLQYNPDHYGPSSGDEYALIKEQLESTELFTVDLQSTEWVQYSEDRTNDVYPLYQLGWFPDYPDPDNYLVPFFYNTEETPSFLGNHYTNEELNTMLTEQASIENDEERAQALGEIQGVLAEELPTLPYLQGNQVAVAGTDVQGFEDTLDSAYQFRLALLGK